MKNNDLQSNIIVALAMAAAVHAATKSDSPIIDLQGAGSATLVIDTGAIVGDGDYTVSLRHGDAADLSGDAECTADDLIGALPETLEASTAYSVGYRGGKRYLRAVITKNSGTSIAAGAVVVKSALYFSGKA